MTLRFEPRIEAADWFARSGEDWVQLCTIGPSGFAAYARLFHPLPAHTDPTDAHAVEDREGDLEKHVLDRLVTHLTRHTSTPEDCFFCLWEGFGEIRGGPAVGFLTPEGTVPPPGRPQPAFPVEVRDGPRVVIPNRGYLLFRGPIDEAGEWGAADILPGWRRRINSPNLMWPADHAWFVATEIDMPWTGVGGSRALVDDLLADNDLDVEECLPAPRLPYWREETTGEG